VLIILLLDDLGLSVSTSEKWGYDSMHFIGLL
jgi:hypothetical protein